MDKETAIKALEERQANPPVKIRNEDLYAGSPMYYYCRFCGALSDTLPEDWNPQYIQPTKICNDCQQMVDHGWLKTTQ